MREVGGWGAEQRDELRGNLRGHKMLPTFSELGLLTGAH